MNYLLNIYAAENVVAKKGILMKNTKRPPSMTLYQYAEASSTKALKCDQVFAEYTPASIFIEGVP